MSTTKVVLVVIFVVALSVLYEAALWTECMADNSFFYCMRVLSK